ncbi:hypothetical protein R1sor_017875 [Riccia sorocarpa]|uniref:Photolyase/cryptochrome alpha/beta domain-containing protein n=1 Tax=Riccia sorocarpa TaxID=122646 RepID=A0ABD3I824_9MARC
MASNFHDLELILDSNVERASGGVSLENVKPLQCSGRAPPQLREQLNNAAKIEVESAVELAAKDGIGISNALPVVSGVASLTLAMGSLLSLPQVASPAQRLGFVPGRKATRKAICSSPVVGAPQMDLYVGASAPKTTSKSKSSISPFPDYQRLHAGQFGDPINPAGLRRATIVWFRNDLRVHDNEALVQASNDSMSIVPVYCFDPRDYGKSSSGFDKTGPYRAKFLLECVANLRDNLRERGSELIVRIGKPEEVLVSIAKSVGADALYAHMEVAHEEMNAEENVSAALKEVGVESKYFWGSTLFHVDDLPFKLEEMPSNYGGFRDKVQGVKVRATVPAPKQLKGLPARGGVKAGDIPSLQDLGLNPSALSRPEKHTAYGGALLVGGENEALQRLRSFVVDASSLSDSKNSKADKGGDSLYGANFSCKISPWLAMGCLSPRRMYEDLNQSNRRVATASAAKSGGISAGGGLDWLVFELLWRDFFRFITKKFGSSKKTSAPATACTGVLAAA